jgi:hypothetical protein
MLRSIGLPELLVILIMGMLLSVIVVIPYWKIFSKAGFSPWLALLMIVPGVSVVVLWVVAFSPWENGQQPPRLPTDVVR